MDLSELETPCLVLDMKKIKKITLRSLDSFDFPTISLIKIDVEGFESMVISGGCKLIERDHPIIIFESWSKEHDSLCKQIEQFGYQISPCPGSLDRADYVAKYI